MKICYSKIPKRILVCDSRFLFQETSNYKWKKSYISLVYNEIYDFLIRSPLVIPRTIHNKSKLQPFNQMSLNMFIVEEKLSFYDCPVHLILGSQLISPKLNFTCSLPAVNSFAPESSWCLLLARSILRRLTCAAKKTQFSVKKINLVSKKSI